MPNQSQPAPVGATPTDGPGSAVGSPPPFVVDHRSGPDWLVHHRAEARERAAHLPLPTSEAEEWRYSRIAELDLARYAAVDHEPGAGAVPAAVTEVLEGLDELAGVVVLVDGSVVLAELGDGAAGAGVAFGSGCGDDIDAAAVLGDAPSHPVDLFAAWNEGLAPEPVVLDVPAAVVVGRPFAVVSYASTPAAATFPRIAVRVGDGAEAELVEVHLSAEVDALVVPVTTIRVGAAGRFRHGVLQDLGREVWQIGSLSSTVERDGHLRVGVAALGGDYARLRLDCRLEGRGSTGDLSSVYLGDGDQMLDLRTFQTHAAPDTTSHLLFKGGVAGRSHSVYTGLIRIAPGARGSHAEQTNRNLKLSDEAWAESVPNLEIENNDVRCSHASTVGPVDADQRFYLESRGVPTPVADRLIVRGFFDEVLDDFATPVLTAAVASRLDSALGASPRGSRGVGSAAVPTPEVAS